ncbi:hypothetical protein PRIEUP_LOCUS1366, partial [Pristimantis euphronides]
MLTATCFFLGINVKVNCTVMSKESTADLICRVSPSVDIVQVTWQKKTQNSYETLVTHSRRFGVKIPDTYKNSISVLENEDPGTSCITLSQQEMEGGSCYTAIFNIYPYGALRGEVCVPNLHGVREVICKSSADFNVTLEPPQIKAQHSEPNGAIIQIGRWVNGIVSPVCNFQLRRKTRTRKSVQDGYEIFTIECKASGNQRPTITWTNEGRPISREETVNKSGDLITVTYTLHHSLSTLSEDDRMRCVISYSKGRLPETTPVYNRKGNPNQTKMWVPSRHCMLFTFFLQYLHFFLYNRKQPNSPKKEDKAEMGCITPMIANKHHTFCNTGTPGTAIKQRTGSSVKKNEDNIRCSRLDSSYGFNNTNEVIGTPESETKQRNMTGQEKKNKFAKKLFE